MGFASIGLTRALAAPALAAIGTLAFATAACGGGGGGAASGGGTPVTSASVTMRDNTFSATSLTVPVGQQVAINLDNKGTAIHNLRIAGPDGKFDTGDDIVSNPDSIRAGASGTVTFTLASAGTFDYRCDFHPTEMKGKVTVK